MHIRKLTAADLGAYREIRAEMCRNHPTAFGQTPDEVMAMPEEMLLDWMSPRDACPEKFVLAAFDDSRILGTTGFRREELSKERHRGFIWSVYVRPEARGRGLAGQLMSRTLETIRQFEGMEIVTLTVAVPQTEARMLYTSFGFFTIGLHIDGYRLGEGTYAHVEEMMLRL
jgi:ribosomal protein S18 acetylase RimI-like enzyme